MKGSLREAVFLSSTVKQSSISGRVPGARKVETNQSKLQTIWEMPSERPVLLLSDFLFHVAGAFRGPVELSVVFSCCPFERCSGLEGEFEGNAITAGKNLILCRWTPVVPICTAGRKHDLDYVEDADLLDTGQWLDLHSWQLGDVCCGPTPPGLSSRRQPALKTTSGQRSRRWK